MGIIIDVIAYIGYEYNCDLLEIQNSVEIQIEIIFSSLKLKLKFLCAIYDNVELKIIFLNDKTKE